MSARKREWVKKKSEKRRRRRPLENTMGLLPSHPPGRGGRRSHRVAGRVDGSASSNCVCLPACLPACRCHNGQIIQMLIWTDSL